MSVISACIKGKMAHTNRGRPSHRGLPEATRQRIVQLARTTYAGFNHHRLCGPFTRRKIAPQHGNR